ncbi:FkbM family methyltransferase [Polymorphum gilvum]|uniref:Methyltransferase FkbM family n=1 Tax=Polymorphum gilvum (strain LMG 25793 / CGMCC 1.9160 / SL003B-26A1) TaxID=991905 RepID=F2IVM5_POLGS|nr:FkbM family methyltransferase [Polymorphum gilvum]ADZ72743.1 Methyltransferase FkbM family [Polymorphum gilvum SL003B-26A1]
MTPLPLEPPFGSLSLPKPLERLRAAAERFPANRFGRVLTSLVRRLCLAGRRDPLDVSPLPTIHARLYPRTNRCEKRAIAGLQFFDLEERQALSGTLAGSQSDPFVFLDLGANVGLYSLWMVSEARRLGKHIAVVAVEPDEVTRARLAANVAASAAAEIRIASCAVGERAGTGMMVRNDRNRGENTVAVTGSSEGFEVLPIHEICRRHDLTHIDAMKIDIEGHDHAALASLFRDGDPALWPDVIVVEAGKREAVPPVIELCLRNGYESVRRTRLNMILRRAPRPTALDE